MLTELFSQLQALPWLKTVEFGSGAKALLILSAVLVIWGLLRLLRRRKSADKGLRALSYGLVLAISTLGYLIVVSQLDRYPLLLPERELVEISFSLNPEAPEEGTYLVRMQSLGEAPVHERLDQQWPIQGQSWRLTTRVLSLPGSRPRVRFHRLITRSEEQLTDDSKTTPQRAYVLNENETPDLWKLLHRQLGGEDRFTQINMTAFMPIEAGQRYRVALTGSEILLRPSEAQR